MVAASLSLDVGYLFLVGSSVPSMVVQQLVAILVLSWETMSAHLLLQYLEPEAPFLFSFFFNSPMRFVTLVQNKETGIQKD